MKEGTVVACSVHEDLFASSSYLSVCVDMSAKVAVVTGGNKGIGLAIVQALCKQYQGDVYLTARDA